LLSKSSGEILFFGLYYVMTGLHGIHVIVGMVLIAVMTRMTRKDIITKDSYVRLENAGLYWHLVDIIWIFLFPLFYLIT
ncbi:MAG: cytochrome c oxidase subunit 3, partial [Ignavibacteriaceae bacterium]|nr:cytochrome c oxidase subunit 3 [Ignavibacteriaceae bacterium]